MNKFLSVRAVAARYEIGISTVWYWVKIERLPKPFKIGPNTTRWKVSELEEMENNAEIIEPGSENAQEKRTRLAAARKKRLGE
jgi:prophage regulatory protein